MLRSKRFWIFAVAIVMALVSVTAPILHSQPVYAEPTTSDTDDIDDEADDEAEVNTYTTKDIQTGIKKCESSLSLGWLFCGIIEFAKKGLDNLYEWVEQFFQINTSFFSGENSNGVRTAWQIFQTFSNVALVILILIVIFSQLTGVGIDNYGIKKILPKIIVVAILINLSYVICQLAVDVSNIVGKSIKDLFINMADTTYQASLANVESGSKVLTTTLEGGGLVVGLAAGVISILGTVSGGAVAVAALVLSTITAIVSAAAGVAVLFILLGVRQAGVILLVVVSPLAIVCYALPNTKPIFDKWFKFLKTLLLLYPTCGAIIGASTLASVILLSVSTNYVWQFMALLVSVIPYFFIPTIVKSALNIMGNVGTRISQLGTKIGGGVGSMAGRAAGKAIERSGAIEQFNENRELRRAKKISEKLSKKQDAGKTLSMRKTRQLDSAHQTITKIEQDRAAREVGADATVHEDRMKQINAQAAGEIGSAKVRINNPNYYTGMTNKAIVGSKIAAEGTANYANNKYVEGTINKAANATKIDETSTARFADGSYAQADLVARQIGEQAAADKTALYIDHETGQPSKYARNVVAGLESKESAERVANAIVGMKEKTNNYDTGKMARLVGDLLKGDVGKIASGGEDEIDFKALIQKMSTKSGFDAKILIDTINGSGTSKEIMSIIAANAQKMPDFAKAINEKDAAFAQYLREFNESSDETNPVKVIVKLEDGSIRPVNDISFEEWLTAQRTNEDGSFGPTNVQFVVKKVTDHDDKLINQTDKAIMRAIDAMVKNSDGTINQKGVEHVRRIYKNGQLEDKISQDVRDYMSEILEKISPLLSQSSAPQNPTQENQNTQNPNPETPSQS